MGGEAAGQAGPGPGSSRSNPGHRSSSAPPRAIREAHREVGGGSGRRTKGEKEGGGVGWQREGGAGRGREGEQGREDEGVTGHRRPLSQGSRSNSTSHMPVSGSESEFIFLKSLSPPCPSQQHQTLRPKTCPLPLPYPALSRPTLPRRPSLACRPTASAAPCAAGTFVPSATRPHTTRAGHVMRPYCRTACIAGPRSHRTRGTAAVVAAR